MLPFPTSLSYSNLPVTVLGRTPFSATRDPLTSTGMAKRNRLRVSKAPVDDQKPTPRHASTLLHPTTRQTIPRRVAAAHEKHKHDNDPPEPIHPTLADRFHALPGELRNHIFAFLLVRPVKWQAEHNASCPLRTSNADITPKPTWPEHNCCRCIGPYHSDSLDQHTSRTIWANPWRSKWAPEVSNGLMCSDCWDQNFRPEYVSSPNHSLPKAPR